MDCQMLASSMHLANLLFAPGKSQLQKKLPPWLWAASSRQGVLPRERLMRFSMGLSHWSLTEACTAKDCWGARGTRSTLRRAGGCVLSLKSSSCLSKSLTAMSTLTAQPVSKWRPLLSTTIEVPSGSTMATLSGPEISTRYSAPSTVTVR